MDYLIVAPDPAGTIESLGALGYTLEAAVADLVDNSIDAGASTVDVILHWSGTDSYFAVVDDGRGMSDAELDEAMTLALRGPSVARSARELGRFGMGLKTASFSQARKLIVWSRALDGKHPAVRVWDLDQVVAARQWRLLTRADARSAEILNELVSKEGNARTIVLWRSLTKLVEDVAGTDDDVGHQHFLEAVARVQAHLGMTFARFISGRAAGRRLHLRVNGDKVTPWDPFLQSNPHTMARPVERLAVEGHMVLVRPFVLPPKRRLSEEQYRAGAGVRGWQEQQGFYVYRNDRLIVAGDWLSLGGFRKDDRHNLARIAIDIPSGLDHLWHVDVRKATAQPPLPLRRQLAAIGRATRNEAQRVQNQLSRTTALTKSDELSYPWRPENRSGRLRLRLNWNHPMIREALRIEPESRATLRALLTLLEETVPLQAVRMMFDGDQDRDYEPFSDKAPDDVLEVARRLYAAYISQRLTPAQARARLRHTPPFDEYPDLLSALELKNEDQEA